MKKIIITCLAFSCLIILGSCKKLVDEKPLSEAVLDDFYKNKYDADGAIAAMYGALQETMVGEGGTSGQFHNRYTFWGEGRSDNMESTPGTGNTSSIREMHYNALTPNNDWTDWTGLYRIIHIANLNIKYIPQINVISAGSPKDQLDNATLNKYMAESYSMRALAYFYIVRLWGDAPLRLEPYLDLSKPAEQARDPQATILDQIIKDLTLAYSIMPKGQNANVWEINEAAMAAMLADVYMWRKDYDNAIIWFKNVFKAKGPTGKVYNAAGTGATGSGGAATDLEPTATWRNVFVTPTASLEAIWNINWVAANNGCPCMTVMSASVNNGPLRTSTEIFLGKTYVSVGGIPTLQVVPPGSPYEWYKSTTDIRFKQTIEYTQSTMASVWKYYAGTYNGTNFSAPRATDKEVYLTMYRLADQYLLYAEALNKKGDRVNALKYLNLIHVRSGQTAYAAGSFNTETLMENAILQERQYELFGEGKRWFDLVRTDKVYEIMDPIMVSRQIFQGATQTGFGPDKNDKRKYLWPLHRNVLNANPLLVQNPPYSD